jgi:hypothetical protein
MTDLAALPTSWALTIWDALPIYLSVGLAAAVIITVSLRPRRRRVAWRLSSAYPLASVAYLFVFDSSLAFVAAGAAIGHVLLTRRLLSVPRDVDAPTDPLLAIKMRGGTIIWDVAKASAVAAILKILVTPVIGDTIGLPLPLGASAIPTVTVWSASGGLFPASMLLAAAAVRPVIARQLVHLTRRFGLSQA